MLACVEIDEGVLQGRHLEIGLRKKDWGLLIDCSHKVKGCGLFGRSIQSRRMLLCRSHLVPKTSCWLVRSCKGDETVLAKSYDKL